MLARVFSFHKWGIGAYDEFFQGCLFYRNYANFKVTSQRNTGAVIHMTHITYLTYVIAPE